MTDHNGSLSNLFLKLSDLFLLLVSLGLTIVHRYSPAENPTFVIDYLSNRIKITNALLGLGLLSSWHVAFAVQGLYVSHRLRAIRPELKEVGSAVLISSVLLLVAANLGKWPTINILTVALFALVSFALIGSGRFILRLNLRRLRRRGHNVKTLLLVGGGARGRQFAARINLRQDLGYRLLGYVDNDRTFAGRDIEGSPWIGTIEELPRIITNEVIDEVAIALPIKSQYSQIEAAVMLLEEQGITTHLMSDLFPQKLARSQSTDLDGLPLVSLHSAPLFSWRTEAKRIFDFAVAWLLLLIAGPALVLVAIIIKLESKGPIFFVQERVGLNKRRFRMLKFRTMQRDAEARMDEVEHLNEKTGPIFKIRNDPRVTSVGRWLRRTSIDELPQLVNVLLGDMSIVGPRPLSVRDATRMELAWQKRRFSVKPGLTCLWQVSGRSNLSFDQWMQLDLEYNGRWSLFPDASSALRTLPAIA